MLTGSLLLFVLFVAASAYFSASETAFTAMDRVDLARRVDQGQRAARGIERLLEHPARLLSAILVGNNLVNAATAALAAVVATHYVEDRAGIVIATLVVTAGLVIFAEVLPKSLALLAPYQLARVSWPLMFLWVWVLFPVTRLIKAVVAPFLWAARRLLVRGPDRAAHPRENPLVWLRHAYAYAVDEAEDAKVDPHPFVMDALERVLHLRDRTVREAAIPREMIVGVRADAPLTEVRGVFEQRRLSRLVVTGADGDVSGYLSLKDLTAFQYAERTTAGALQRPIAAIDADETLDDALQIFLARSIHIAVVRAGAATVGLITLEDLLESMVGPIRDEHDDPERQRLVTLPNGIVLVAGWAVLRDLETLLDHEFGDADRSRTVTDWAHEQLGDRVRPGDTFFCNGIELAVDRLRGRRISRLRFRAAPRPEPADADQTLTAPGAGAGI